MNTYSTRRKYLQQACLTFSHVLSAPALTRQSRMANNSLALCKPPTRLSTSTGVPLYLPSLHRGAAPSGVPAHRLDGWMCTTAICARAHPLPS